MLSAPAYADLDHRSVDLILESVECSLHCRSDLPGTRRSTIVQTGLQCGLLLVLVLLLACHSQAQGARDRGNPGSTKRRVLHPGPRES